MGIFRRKKKPTCYYKYDGCILLFNGKEDKNNKLMRTRFGIRQYDAIKMFYRFLKNNNFFTQYLTYYQMNLSNQRTLAQQIRIGFERPFDDLIEKMITRGNR